MKVVNLSLDPQILNVEGVAASRNRMYGELVEKYTIIVHGQEDSSVELSPNVTVYCVGGTNKIIRLFRMYKKVGSLIRTGECDVLTSQDPYYLGCMAYFLAKQHHLGFEVHVLGIEKLHSVRKHIAKFVLKRAGSIRANSVRLKQRLVDEFGVQEEKILMVPIYIPLDSLGFDTLPTGSTDALGQARLKEDFREKYGDRFNFLTVLRLVEVKNIPMQIAAVKALKDTHPEILLHIVGGGPLEHKIREEIRNNGLEKHVILHGPKDGLALGVFYTESDCFLLTSNAEGWPMVIFEATSAGLPIIMTDVGCAGEFIVHDTTGVVVPVRDVEALRNEMKRIMEDEALRLRLVQGAQTQLKGYWTLEEILKGYKKSWEVALKNKF